MNSIDGAICQALIEDVGDGDHTSLACIPKEAIGKVHLLVKANGILAGVNIAQRVFNMVDPDIRFHSLLQDGSPIAVGDIAFEAGGRIQSLLKSERLVLNFMQRMSGIATHTHHLVQKIAHTHAQLLDTRKTTPNVRIFEKMAVIIGGGQNHRFGLFDMILIKDNHVDFAGGIKQAIKATQDYLHATHRQLSVEIEVRSFDELQQVLDYGGIDRIMLDNFTPDNLAKAVAIVNHRYQTEASGNITNDTIVAYAETGIDYISVGSLTHQIQSLDLSLKAFD
ncbi:nicotinate-nucleotide diphosphorylase (carboxylating) [Bacteroidia bacterium]|nr:nicotinate-nucleotide diphosphorylase (carboxylating) [Bacteroidia bacterium]